MNYQAQIQLADKLLKNIEKLGVRQKTFQTSLQKLRSSQEKTDKQIQELRTSQEKTDKQIQKLRSSQEKTDKQIQELRTSQKAFQESQKETSKQIDQLGVSQKKTDKMIQKVGGRFNERWGHLVESLVKGKLVQLFQEQNIDVTETHERSVGTWKIPKGEIKTREIDILVANGTEAVAVEVKTTLSESHVDYFLESLKDFKKYFKRFKKETIYGAMAFLKAEDTALEKAEESGLFIISATGDSARLINKKGFKPKAFC